VRDTKLFTRKQGNELNDADASQVAAAQMVGILSHTQGEAVGLKGIHLSGQEAGNPSKWRLSRQGLEENYDYLQGARLSNDANELVQWWTGVRCPEGIASN
jgi:hypothetical protein